MELLYIFCHLIPTFPSIYHLVSSLSHGKTKNKINTDEKQPLPITVGEGVGQPLMHMEPPAADSPATERINRE